MTQVEFNQMLQTAIAQGAVGGYYTSKYSGEEIDQRLGGSSIYDYAVEGGYTGTEAEFQALMGSGPWVQQAGFVPASNTNLLDNWYFPDPINQRQNDSYSSPGSKTYTIDRWWGLYKCSISLTQKGLHILGSDSNTGLYSAEFDQTLPFSQDHPLVGAPVTLSVLYQLSNQVKLATVTTKLGVSKTHVSEDNLRLIISEYNSDFGFYSGIGLVKPLIEVTVIAAKLELGPVQTLAHAEGDTWVLNDPPPDKALELAKCQRYFISNIDGVKCWENSSVQSFLISTPTTMKATPTIIGTLSGAIIGNNNMITIPISEANVSLHLRQNCIYILLNYSTKYSKIMLLDDSGLSCDL